MGAIIGGLVILQKLRPKVSVESLITSFIGLVAIVIFHNRICMRFCVVLIYY
jgi:heme A synthase